ncbi:MAG: ABC transporter substrate-binding protein [Proteobacteria bacterium]|nr:ABC transporter substrate-binding protein [Pseudomonadota bacterium]
MILHLLGAGASKGLVADVQARFTAATGAELVAFFNAAGPIRDRVLAGEACDVVILTADLLDALAARGLLAGPAVPLGRVRTGVAVPAGHPVPDVATAAALRDALLAARGVYVPDPQGSTAGIHVMRVLRALGIEAAVAPYLRPFPNGATAMRALAEASEDNAIGCTQISEITYTQGLTLAGPLPEAHGLATIYAAAVRAGTAQPAAAQALVALLTGPETAGLRHAGGFEPVAAGG